MRDSDWLKLNLRLIFLIIAFKRGFYATGPWTHTGSGIIISDKRHAGSYAYSFMMFIHGV